MDSVEKIQEAEANVAQIQDALAALQTGLQRAESVASAAEEARARSEQTFKLTVGLMGLALVLVVVTLRRRRS